LSVFFPVLVCCTKKNLATLQESPNAPIKCSYLGMKNIPTSILTPRCLGSCFGLGSRTEGLDWIFKNAEMEEMMNDDANYWLRMLRH
jgi:hypothetical protein